MVQLHNALPLCVPGARTSTWRSASRCNQLRINSKSTRKSGDDRAQFMPSDICFNINSWSINFCISSPHSSVANQWEANLAFFGFDSAIGEVEVQHTWKQRTNLAKVGQPHTKAHQALGATVQRCVGSDEC